MRSVPGCLGIAGGSLLETITDEKGSYENCYLVYVGWRSVADHEAYHHTEHFAKRRVVLGLGNGGYREYAHVRFEGERVKGGGAAKL